MNLLALREKHRTVFGNEAASSHRQFLFRKIARRYQADAEGCQPDQVRGGIARSSPLRNRVITNASKRRTGLPPEQTTVATIQPDRDPRLPFGAREKLLRAAQIE